MANGIEMITWEDPAITARNDYTGVWQSEVYTFDEPMSHIVPSWQLLGSDGLDGPQISVSIQATDSNGRYSHLRSFGSYAFDSEGEDMAMSSRRATANERPGPVGNVDQDTFVTNGDPIRAVRFNIWTHSPPGSPEFLVRSLSMVASNQYKIRQSAQEVYPSRPLSRSEVALPVPAISQHNLDDVYPSLDGGGRTWCSPTSVAMNMAYWGVGPSPSELAQLPTVNGPAEAGAELYEPVAHAAYHIFDNRRHNKPTGNWSFNTAYAAHYGLDARVVAYPDLRSVEERLQDGKPTVLTIDWDNESIDLGRHLSGAHLVRSAGHLVVATGVTREGDIRVNDPAAAGDDDVPTIYDRSQLERAWRRRGGWAYAIDQRPGGL